MRSNTQAPKAAPRSPAALAIASLAAILFLNLPFLVVVLYSLTTDEQTFTFPLPGLTLRWFGEALQRADLWNSLRLSLTVALGATLVAILLGTLAALAVH